MDGHGQEGGDYQQEGGDYHEGDHEGGEGHEGHEGGHEGHDNAGGEPAAEGAAAPEGEDDRRGQPSAPGDNRERRQRGQKQQQRVVKAPAHFEPKKGCCPACLKAFSASGRSCRCQVPYTRLADALPPEGCQNCGCKGC